MIPEVLQMISLAHTYLQPTSAPNGSPSMPKHYRKVEIKYSKFGVEVGVPGLGDLERNDAHPNIPYICRISISSAFPESTSPWYKLTSPDKQILQQDST